MTIFITLKILGSLESSLESEKTTYRTDFGNSQISWFLNGIYYLFQNDWTPLFYPQDQGDSLEAFSGP